MHHTTLTSNMYIINTYRYCHICSAVDGFSNVIANSAFGSNTAAAVVEGESRQLVPEYVEGGDQAQEMQQAEQSMA